MSADQRARLALALSTLACAGVVLLALALALTRVEAQPEPSWAPQTNAAALAIWQGLTPAQQAKVCDYADSTDDPWGAVRWNADVPKADWEAFIAQQCA